MKMLQPRPALLLFLCFLLVRAGLSGQEAETPGITVFAETKASGREYRPREQNLLIDIPLTVAEVVAINLFGNMWWRLWGPDSEVAYFTVESIRANAHPSTSVWSYEEGQGGDTFLVNNLFHPFAGGYYFASARSNNFNFYWSVVASFFGSASFEILGETLTPSTTDLINTTFGGIAIGEILHRLYLEFDKYGAGGKIGSTLLSPTDRITAAVRGYGPEKGPNKISDASLSFGIPWLTARFFENGDEVESWDAPAAFIGVDLVYGDPYTARSKTPFDQFDLNVSITMAVPFIHNIVFITDGYLASWLLADDETNQASGGPTLHWDLFVTDKGFIDLNSGRENLSFNANSLDYSIKWRRLLNASWAFSLKAHLGFSPWAMTDYNGGVNRDDYNLYLIGGNLKLFLELRQTPNTSKKIGQVLSLSLCFYDTWSLPKTPGPETNTLFLYSKLAYSFPFTGRLSFYAADNFLLLHCRLTRDLGMEFPDITRWYNSAQLGMKVSF